MMSLALTMPMTRPPCTMGMRRTICSSMIPASSSTGVSSEATTGSGVITSATVSPPRRPPPPPPPPPPRRPPPPPPPPPPPAGVHHRRAVDPVVEKQLPSILDGHIRGEADHVRRHDLPGFHLAASPHGCSSASCFAPRSEQTFG